MKKFLIALTLLVFFATIFLIVHTFFDLVTTAAPVSPDWGIAKDSPFR